MIGTIHPGLLVAGGIGAAGVGYLMFRGKGDEAKEGAGTDPAAPATPGGTTPTGTTIAPGGTAPGAAALGTGTAGAMPFADAGSAASSGIPTPAAGELRGEQVGPYTVVPDASGVDLVYETATQQLKGVLDGQGNLRPVTVGADGTVSLAQEQSTQGALGPSPHPGTGAATGATMSAATSESDAVYARMAAELFAGGSTPAIGAGSTDAAIGATNVSPQALATAGTVTPAATGQALAGAGQVKTQQVGEFTLVDDGSGITQVYDTASQQLLGTMDQAGNVTPAGGAATGSMPTGVTGPATPAALGASVPVASQGALPIAG